ncbi:MAG: PDGLE domain-containing protein [Verrucomicrobiota bacterium]
MQPGGRAGGRPWGELVRYGLLVSVGLAVFVAPFACPWPDGLESVAAKLGFAPAPAVTPALPALAPDYAVPGIHSAVLATALAGAAGCLIVFALALLLGRVLVPNAHRCGVRRTPQSMKLHLLEPRHARPNSLICRLPAELKLGVGLVLITLTVLLPPAAMAWFFCLAGLLAMVTVISRICTAISAQAPPAAVTVCAGRNARQCLPTGVSGALAMAGGAKRSLSAHRHPGVEHHAVWRSPARVAAKFTCRPCSLPRLP